MELGTESPELQRLLPPTDIRRRRDVRALDSGRYKQARLETLHLAKAPSPAQDMTLCSPEELANYGRCLVQSGCTGPARR